MWKNEAMENLLAMNLQELYCLYLRKSRADLEAENRGEGETLERHRKLLLELAKKMNINITKIYSEIVSGETIASRPVMQELLKDVESGMWNGVLVVEVERLARGDTMDQGLVAQTFKYSNTKIITPMKVYDPSNEFDEEYFEFGLFMSRREYKTINRRLQRGRIESVKEGKFLGTIAPYGYDRVKLKDQKGYSLEPNEEDKIVQLIFDWYTGSERIGVSIIARKLNEMKIPARKGGDWTTSTIRDILLNPTYIGKIRWNWRPHVKSVLDGEVITKRPRASKEDWIYVNGLHKPLISQETFQLAQKYLSQNPSVPVPSRYKVKNPLSGLVVCGVCRRKMSRKPYKKYPDALYCTGPTCTNVSSPLQLVEEKLLESLKIWLENYKIEIKQKEAKGNNIETDLVKNSIVNIDTELKTLQSQLNNLYDLLEQGIYSTDLFLERSKIINDKINDMNINKKKLEKKFNNIINLNNSKTEMIPKIEKVIDIYWKSDTPKEKNNLLKEVIDKVVYTKKEGGRWSGKVDDFVLDLYPKLPE